MFRNSWFGRKFMTGALAVMLGAACAAAGAMPVPAGEAQTEAASEAVSENGMTGAQAARLSDGEYQITVNLEGGSGKAAIDSPAKLTVKNGQMTLEVVWSSSHYDYMKVGGTQYLPVNTEGNSVFEIPVETIEQPLDVVADTTAMSVPHEIEYTISFETDSLSDYEEGSTEAVTESAAPEAQQETQTEETVPYEAPEIEGLTYDHSLELTHADQFHVDYYEGGYKYISIQDTDHFLIVPENAQVPDGLDEDIVVLQQPFDNIYMVATSVMDFFVSLDSLDHIKLSGTKAEGWYVDEARQAMEEGSIIYAGKYSAPDYELIVSEGCDLAIESTMIWHTPEVQEKLEDFGIPVLVERSSYESDPLGRSEWIKLYGALLNKEEQAAALFDEMEQKVEAVENEENTGLTVAYFSLNSNGGVTVRKTADYISKMIGMAGGEYIFTDLGDDEASSTMNMQMEEFYATAKNADFLIYNGTIEGEMADLNALLARNELFADFKAVKEGHVWCTTQNLFQKTTGLADMIVDIHTMLTQGTDAPDTLTYIYRLK